MTTEEAQKHFINKIAELVYRKRFSGQYHEWVSDIVALKLVRKFSREYPDTFERKSFLVACGCDPNKEIHGNWGLEF